MFKFKMLTKVLVAVIVFGQVIESNLNLCIALSIDLDAPPANVKLHKSWKSNSDSPQGLVPASSNQGAESDDSTGPLASRTPASIQLDSTTTEGGGPKANASAAILSQRLESNGKLNYFGTIHVGADRVPFIVLFDLTSSGFWLPSSECKSIFCISRQKYNASASVSASSEPDDRQLNWTYSGNVQAAQVSTRLVRDTITFAGVTIEQQTFGEAITMEGEPFAYLPVDGFLGLGFKNYDSSGKAADSTSLETPFDRLYRMGLLKEPIFSLLIKDEVDEWQYSADNGELILGQLAAGYQASDITYVPVTHVDYWEFRLSAVTLRQSIGDLDIEQACESACPAILDTGAGLISGHFTDVDRLNRALGAYPVGNGMYKLSYCDLTLMPNLILTIGGAEFSLAPEEYLIINQIRGNILSCYSALRVVNADQYPYWILGEQFLKRHYVVFDYGQKRLGFAKAKRPVRKTEVDMYGRIRKRKQII